MSVAAWIFWPLAAYLFGAVPFGLLLARAKGVDLRCHGSGNIGATNVARVLGKRLGLITLSADLSKGLVPVLGCRMAMEGNPDMELYIALAGVGAVIGHCYPVFLRFRGGKGVSTAAGVFLGICPVVLAFAMAGFVLAVKKCGYVSVGSLSAAVIIPVLLHFLCPGRDLELMAWFVAIVIWWKHRENIGRLLRGEEKGWRRREDTLERLGGP
jgi:glycerol-3-phosphate acyltransferase PlsY